VSSLRRRFVWSSVTVFTGLSAAMLLAVNVMTGPALDDLVSRAAARNEALLSAALAPLAASRNLAEGQDLVARLVNDGHFVYVQVDDAAGRSWARAGPEPAPGGAGAVTPDNGHVRRADGAYHGGGTLMLDGRRFGSFRFGFTDEPVRRAERGVLAGLLAIGLFGLLVASMVQVLLARRLTRGLQELAVGADRVAGGEQGVQIAPLGDDEIGRLAGSFNRMSAALAQRVSALEHSELRQRQLVEAVAVGVVFQDRNDRVLECNEAAARILGLTREQLLGLDSLDPRWRAVKPDGTSFDFSQHPSMVALRSGEPVFGVLLGVDRPDGTRAWLSINAQPLRAAAGAEPHGAVTSFADVSVLIEAERTLLQANEELERRVAERTAQLAASRDTAESANRAKTEFLSRMSHELRTPLNAILGFAQVLRLQLGPAGTVDEQLAHIETAGWHLLDLINEVLDLSRIEAGAMSVSVDAVPLAPLFEEAVRLVDGMARSARVQMKLQPLPAQLVVQADRTRLLQVLVNLLSNASKYNRPGGLVGLAAFVQDEQVLIEVSDTGAGLDAAQIDALYQPFNRLGAERGPVEGTGIGLVITKRLVELMQGSLEVRSTLGGGTTFGVRLRLLLPLLPLPRPAAPAI